MKLSLIIQAIILTFSLQFIGNNLVAQKSKMDLQFEKQYKKNIRKSRINGVYIPKDLSDVYKELSELSSENALNKFKFGKEDVVAKKLALGLGRWIYVNWNFYEGSRISHLLKTKYGITHPDDMSEFLIICFHRHLNKKAINEKSLAEKIVSSRLKLLVKDKIIHKSKLKKREKSNG